MKKHLLAAITLICGLTAVASTTGYSASMVGSHGREWTDGKSWDYVNGLVAKTILMYCDQYSDDELSARSLGWVKSYADMAIDSDGNFFNFKKGSLDNIASGKILIDLYERECESNPAQAERYRAAAEYLYEYLRYDYTRITKSDGKGGFIHKKQYPNQMWLDGLYMGAAFYAEYLAAFAPDDADAWVDVALQFTTIHSHTFDAAKKLNYHGWSADPKDSNSFWANTSDPFKGCSKEFWGRGMGWYAAALVDVLALMPADHPDYTAVADILTDVAEGILRWQDDASGVWYQLLQYDNSFVSAGGNRNYLEASVSCMFTYALFKGIRLGLLDNAQYGSAAVKAYNGLIDTFITENTGGVDIHKICRSAGLGPNYNWERNGTADYYLDGSDVTVVSNEGKGIGSFIMASLEYERYTEAMSGIAPAVEQPESPSIYYDIYGRRYPTAPQGLYIEISNGKATKKLGR